MNKLTTEQYQALANFAKVHGRRWKAILNNAWMNGNYPSDSKASILQGIRNKFGPTWLANFSLSFERDKRRVQAEMDKRSSATKPEPVQSAPAVPIYLDTANRIEEIMPGLLRDYTPQAILRALLSAMETDTTEYLESERFGIAICKAEIKQCADTIQKRFNRSAPADFVKAKAYANGRYTCPAPPVCTSLWNDADWITWIDNHGLWLDARAEQG